MGASVTRHDFDWADDYHTHTRRRKAILEKYPQIRELMVYDPVFKWRVLSLVAIQIISFYLLRNVQNVAILSILAYFFGGVINHSLTLAIHDISHNQAYGYGRPLANRLFGMVANLPLGIPSSITFRKYHEDHHKYLGKVADTDVPTEWEGRFFNNTPRKVLWLFLNPLFYAIRPMIVSPKSITKLEILNLIIQLSFDWIIYYYCGLHVLLYMIIGTFICLGLHPIAGHFLTEHYVYFYESDYLKKLYTHQKDLGEKLLVPETFSYYGSFNAITFNVGYHVEHHDFPSIPSSLLPRVRQIAPEFYEPLCYHTSWIKALLRYIFDPRMNPFARIRRRELYMEYMNNNKVKYDSMVNEQQVKENNGDMNESNSNDMENVDQNSCLNVKHTHRDCWFSEYKCDNGQCIQAYAVCNGQSDCVDGSDEKQCHEQDFIYCDHGVSVHRSLW
ncbi:hypothetical protein RDWZM_001916 [Blomia tropicalis]|uniref:sphingolipid 4-desaturase n=1 Tax=Blomia tropicalis TaxID=40697 RepID=A0A9Q0RR36_BLOTA|nr:hypothetical protein RDWZM_001916 [Blomia tropicalis]